MAAKHHRRLALQLVLMVMMLNVALPEAAISKAKPGCQQLCGNVVISYPFGIGNTSCFHNEWFEVVCGDNITSSPKPILKKLNVEVIEIEWPTLGSQTGWVSIANPIMASSSDCFSGTGKATPSTALDFTGSNFYFSDRLNRFAGSGCTNQAMLIDGNGRNVPDTGCTSICSSDTRIGDCCRSSIPMSIQLFNVSFTSTSGVDDVDCKYAMIASLGDWLDDHPTTSCSSAIKDTDSVPAWLEWGLKSDTPEALALIQQSKAKNTTIGINTYTYGDGTELQYAYCDKGFEGSAYVTDGCQDINECLDNPCTNGTCVNTYGGYQCIGEKSLHSQLTQIAITVSCVILGVLLLTLAIWGGFKLMRRRQEKKFFVQNGGLLLETEGNSGQTKLYKAHELKTATNNFSKKNRLGEGGQGTVYKGTLPGGTTVVAIKVCKKIQPSKKPKHSKAADKSREAGDETGGAFITEVNLLSKTIHTNIVKLLGCCLETEAPLLVYEYLVNGDLSHHLHSNDKNNPDLLSWELRLKIAAETAAGLSYLHLWAGVPIYHRDIKSENILLDNKYTAKIADFGISKSVSPNQSRVNVEVQGSRGYMDPEYMDSKQYTDKSDVYSFGVVLAELLTGKRPVFPYTSPNGEEKPVILADHFKSLDTAKIMGTFLDGRVKHQGKANELEDVIDLAKRCLEREGRNRPSMREVSMELERIRAEHTKVYADEIDEHDYDQSGDIIATRLGGQQTPRIPIQ